jgi:hypothetical protein
LQARDTGGRLLRIEDGYCCDPHDVVDLGVALQDVHGLRETGQQRTDQLGAAEMVAEFVSDVAGFEIGEDQDVGAAF